MWRLSEFSPLLVDHEACVLGSQKPRFLYKVASSLSLSLTHSFIQFMFVKSLPCARRSARLNRAVVSRKKSSDSTHVSWSLVGETDIKSGSSWSTPWWLAWNRPSINVGWFANKDPHKPCNEGREHSAGRTQFILSLTREHAVLPWARDVHTWGVSNKNFGFSALWFSLTSYVSEQPIMRWSMRISWRGQRVEKEGGCRCFVSDASVILIWTTGRLWSEE